MKKIYENTWHNIPFHSFSSYNPEKLANETFYKQFYDEFFKRYSAWEKLDSIWRQEKIKIGKFILNRIAPEKKILSIGCGLGIIEKYLYESGLHNITIQDTTDSPLLWIREIIPKSSIYSGKFPECLPSNTLYDLIYMSIIDYSFNHNDWNHFLISVREKLRDKGRCLIITHNVYLPQNLWKNTLWDLKRVTKKTLSTLKLRTPDQFWGWTRTKIEHHNSLNAAGLRVQREGSLGDNPSDNKLYWFECSIE
jgi:SAM-dependent methyltransferase